METRIFPDAATVAREAARVIAKEATAAAESRRRFVFAVSGGRTPWQMLRALSEEKLPWLQMHILQVDERVAPQGDPDRNLTHIMKSLSGAPLPPTHIHPMAVEMPDLQSAAAQYAALLRELAGELPVLDLVHLGLGADGHTASLVPGDPVLDTMDSDVAITGPYQERRRMTLTFPVINRCRRILWVVTGSEKAEMLARLLRQDSSIPAGRINPNNALLFADYAAAKG